MSIERVPKRPPAVPDEDASTELLDLDARLGLSAFEPERPAAVVPFDSTRDVTADTREAEPEWGGLPTDVGAPIVPGATTPEPSSGRLPAWVRLPGRNGIVAGALGVALILIAVLVWSSRRQAPPAASGELTVASTPPGALVTIAGKEYGRTPISVSLPPRSYQVELRAGDQRLVLPIEVKAGANAAQHVYLGGVESPAAGGRLHVTSDPPAASVTVDGKRRGRTPLVLTDLQPGAHEIVVSGTTGEVRQRVEVDAESTTKMMVPLPKGGAATAGAAGGWLTVRAPLELQIFEGDRLVGTTAVSRLMLTTGTHTLRLANEAAGVELTRDVRITSGQTARLDVRLPTGTLSVNAVPWALVSVDGREVGETPLGGIELPPGPHEVVFRHPQLGERRQQVMVRSGTPVRLSLDLRQ